MGQGKRQLCTYSTAQLKVLGLASLLPRQLVAWGKMARPLQFHSSHIVEQVEARLRTRNSSSKSINTESHHLLHQEALMDQENQLPTKCSESSKASFLSSVARCSRYIISDASKKVKAHTHILSFGKVPVKKILSFQTPQEADKTFHYIYRK